MSKEALVSWRHRVIVDRSPGPSPAQLEELRATDVELEAHAGDDLETATSADDRCTEWVGVMSADWLCGIRREEHTAESVASRGLHAHEFIGVNDKGSCVTAR